MKVFAASEKASRGPATGYGGLESKTATGENKFMKSKTKTKEKGNLRPRRSTAKLLGMTSATNELRNGEIESGRERKRERKGLDGGIYRRTGAVEARALPHGASRPGMKAPLMTRMKGAIKTE